MPKDRRERSLSLDRSRLSPFPCSSSKVTLEDNENIREWEDARCPVCMEHPHNAILLICASHDKGCRPFMCDTSYRHSNCFDQFRKSLGEASAVEDRPGDVPNSVSSLLFAAATSEAASSDLVDGRSLEGSRTTDTLPLEDPVKPKLVCPLCRGLINGWTVVETARRFMNSKSRSCACETCDFCGTYADLRKHARSMHPLVRPTDADPERQRNWRRLERQRDLGDLLSTFQSAIGEERTDESTITIDDGGWMTVFFLVRFIRPGNTSSRSSTSRARARVAVARRRPRRLWGETLDADPDSRDDEHESADSEQVLTRRNVRRRLNDPEDQ